MGVKSKFFFIAKQKYMAYFKFLLVSNMLITILILRFASTESFSNILKSSRGAVDRFLGHETVNEELGFQETTESLSRVCKDFRALTEFYVEKVDPDVLFELQYTLENGMTLTKEFSDKSHLPFDPENSNSLKVFLSKVILVTFAFKNVKILLDELGSQKLMMQIYIHYYVSFPFKTIIRSEFVLQKVESDLSSILRFSPFAILIVINLLISITLFKHAFVVLSDVLYISHVVSHPAETPHTRKLIVLSFNHCRFLNQTLIAKQKKHEFYEEEFFEHLKCLKPRFYISIFGYIMGCYQALIFFTGIFSTGIVSRQHLYVVSIMVFLSISDFATVFVGNSKFNLMAVLIRKQIGIFLQVISGIVVFFFCFSMILFHLYGFYPRFSSIKATAIMLIALLNGDSVKDTFDEVIESPFAIVMISIFILFFFLGFVPITIGMMSVGFQNVRKKFEDAKIKKSTQKLEFRQKSKTTEEKFKKSVTTREALVVEFKNRYQDRIFLLVERIKLAGKAKERRISQQKPPDRLNSAKRNLFPSLMPTGSELDSDDGADIREEISLSVVRHEDFDNYLDQIVRAQRQMIYDLMIHFEFYYFFVLKSVDELARLKDSKKFSFVLGMARSEVIQSLIEDLRDLQFKVSNLLKTSNVFLGL